MNNFCLIGYPLGHSMSPIIHKELFKIKNIDASYNLNEIAPENLKIEYKKLKKLDGFGGHPQFSAALIANGKDAQLIF